MQPVRTLGFPARLFLAGPSIPAMKETAYQQPISIERSEILQALNCDIKRFPWKKKGKQE
jgi:hypothetical protein